MLNPETIFARYANDDERRNWISRNFGKIKNWSKNLRNVLVPQAYGGLYLSTPFTHSPPTALSTTWQKIVGFDASVAPPPKGVEVGVDRIRVLEEGVFVWEFAAVGEITSFSSNSAQTIELAAYNETQGIPHLVAYHPVPRYSDVYDVTLTGMRPMPYGNTQIGDWVSLWMRIRTASPAISVNTSEQLELSVYRVGT